MYEAAEHTDNVSDASHDASVSRVHGEVAGIAELRDENSVLPPAGSHTQTNSEPQELQ